MTPIERLHTSLTNLGLKAVEARLENLLEQASKKEPSYADFLEDLLGCEVEARRSRYLRARLQLAHLPYLKTFEQFDFGFQPSIDEKQIRELRTLRFVHEASNVILLGPPGVGKTHLSVALAEAAIQSGFGAYFMTAHDLVHDLGRAYREGRLDRRMRVYLAPKVLIIDEMGYLPLDELGATIFFQLVSAATNAAASFSLPTRAMEIGVRFSAIRSSPQRFWIGCCITRRRSISAARVTLEGATQSRSVPPSRGGNQTSPLSLIRDCRERSSLSRVRSAAQKQRALDGSGPF
jgi:DNA replication protein DnaC